MKKNIYLLASLSSIAVISFIGIHFIAPYAILKPPKVNDLIAKQFKQNLEPLNISTVDGIELSAYWITPINPPRGCLILLHGVGGCKEHFLGVANKLRQQDIASIVFDSRAHGQSGGQFCTYGAKEKKDVSVIIDLIEARYPNTLIGIWGNSMGGAVAIQAMAIDKRISFGVIESTFTSLAKIGFDYQKRLSKISSRRLFNYVLKRVEKIANFNPATVRPIEAVKHIDQPMLIAHGDADKNIHFEYGQALFNALAATDKEFVPVPNGGHTGLFITGGKEYENKLFNFIDRQLSTPIESLPNQVNNSRLH